MKWELTEPSLGDMIRVKVGDIYHVGVYVDDSEVIQFGLAPNMRHAVPDSEVKVLASDIDTFLAGGFLEVAVLDRKERKKRRSPDKTVEFARSKIGEGGYNIIHNNCEHFATLAVLGERACAQADSVRALFKSLPLLDVYVARIPSDDIDLSSIASAKRRAYIEAASNESVRRERYFVWRLLEYAVQRTFGKRLADLSAVQTASGAWQVEGVELSLTHTDGVVAVAVSRSAVGVDIEHEATERVEKLAGKILTESERVELDAITAPEGARSYIIERWCMKESIFKKSGEGAFVPSSVDTARGGALVRRISVGTESLVLAVASDHPDRLRLYEDVEIS